MNALPVFMKLTGRACLVVGGGAAAAAKARLLAQAGAEVTVVAPRIGRSLDALIAEREVAWIARDFVPADLAGRALAIGASGSDALDRSVAEAARAVNLPVNVVDRPELSDFLMPAIVDRDPVVVAISTGGAAPVLARRIRAAIEASLPPGIGRLARFALSFRGAVRAKIGEPEARRRFWEALVDGPIAAAVLQGEVGAARRALLDLINRPGRLPPPGGVSIVGAGPGDPELLTLRALRRIQQADLLIHDKLIGPDILDYARRDAERIYVGKTRGRHAKTQSEINALMAAHARRGRRVVRLKGGDPFVFGRGGEELDYLAEQGIAVEVVPGITAATGCAAQAGSPLTHRDHAGAVTFISGHSKDGAPDADWSGLARGGQTVVVYMGVATAGFIADRLIGHGMNPATPTAIVENGTRADQRLVVGRLADLARLIAGHRIDGPALIIIGEVVRAAARNVAAPPAFRSRTEDRALAAAG